MTELKPLYWKPEPGIGYNVFRREDGGMTVTFTDLSDVTIKHWHDFAMEHLLGSDRLTRNLYDLRRVDEIPQAAVHAAIDVNSDPAARNIRVAVVVNSEKVAQAVREMYYQSLPETSAAIKIFTDIDTAEDWLSQPLDRMV
jgi:MFS superfamily sulfate permease-like transporter